MRQQTSVFIRIGVASLAILLIICGLSAPVFAQGGTGTITGTVIDPKGLAVPDAKVSILNTDTGIDRPLATTDAGVYTATFLQPGHYQVTVSKDGFSTWVRKDLLLQVGQTLTIDAPLTVGTAVQQVTVTGEAPLIEPDRTEMSQGVSETLAGGLPLNGRRWEQFVLLTPGVTTDGGSGLVSYHGISGLFNNSSVDGTSNQQAFFSETRGRTSVGYTYSLDAVKEFNVSSSAYSAEFGSAAGGQVNAITKSGTNDLHGDAFYYLRYPTLNAFDPFSKGTAIKNGLTPTQTEHQRQQFGTSVGGPIRKDKLFYFVNYDGQRRSFPIFYTGPSTPNSALAVGNLNGNNCGTNTASNPVMVGANSVTITGLTTAQCTAALNYITGNIGPQPRKGNQDIFLGKLDYQSTTNNHLNVSFNWMNWKAPNDYQIAPTRSADSDTTNGSYGTHDRFLVGNWNTIISSTIVNDFRFQWSRDFEFYGANFGGPSVSLSSLFQYGMPNALPRPAFPDEHRLQFADSVSWVHDRHTFKFGVDISPVHELLVNLFQGGGVYSYSYSDTTANSAAATLQAWIADVYNLPLSIDPIVGGVDTRLGQHYNTFVQVKDVLNPAQLAGKDDFYDVHYATYAQDSWKVASNLTLNLGLRWDMQRIPQPPNPNQNTFANYYTNKINISKFNFGPRLGAAWQLSKNTVVRAGYGIFYGNTTNSLFYNTRVENGAVQKTYNCNASYTPSTGTAGAVAACAPLFPNVIFNPPGPALQAPFAGAVTPTSLNIDPSTLSVSSLAVRGQVPDFLEPMVHEAEIGVEQQLPGNISASETIMFTKGQHLPVCTEANVAPAGTAIGGAAGPPTITYNVFPGTLANGRSLAASTVTVPFYTSRLNTGIGIVSACQSIIHSEYWGLVTTVKKRFGHGFEFLANYTLSKAKDDGQVLGSTGTFAGSSDAPLDPYNQNPEWSNSDYDQRHRFVTSLLYTPTFNTKNSVLNYIVNGFGFGGVITISSPLPVNALMSSTFSPSYVFNGVKYTGIDGGATGGAQLNASNTASRIPNFPKNIFRGPTQVRNVDFRITRDIKLYRERYRLQIIAEAFNLFNHTMFTTVNTSAYSYSANIGSTGAGTATSCNTANTVSPITNGFPCLVAQSSFLTPTATSNNLITARQLQISGKFFF
jgi:hypothetical protein